MRTYLSSTFLIPPSLSIHVIATWVPSRHGGHRNSQSSNVSSSPAWGSRFGLPRPIQTPRLPFSRLVLRTSSQLTPRDLLCRPPVTITPISASERNRQQHQRRRGSDYEQGAVPSSPGTPRRFSKHFSCYLLSCRNFSAVCLCYLSDAGRFVVDAGMMHTDRPDTDMPDRDQDSQTHRWASDGAFGATPPLCPASLLPLNLRASIFLQTSELGLPDDCRTTGSPCPHGNWSSTPGSVLSLYSAPLFCFCSPASTWHWLFVSP